MLVVANNNFMKQELLLTAGCSLVFYIRTGLTLVFSIFTL